jgi:glycosyltransferase involved in cell wall biosynthesis
MKPTEITAIVNAHREGLLVHSALVSVREAANAAQRQGLQVDTIVVLDRSDELTREVCQQFASQNSNITVVEVKNGDPGLSRNHGIELAQGDWIAFLDADDIWSANWLSAAYRSALMEGHREVVWHPEVNLYFGEQKRIFVHIDMESEDYKQSYLAFTNYWSALCFARRSLLLELPYTQTRRDIQLGYEDWGWNIEAIAIGAVHKVVPDTVHGIRVKGTSVLKMDNEAGCLPHPTSLFRKHLRLPQAATPRTGIR